MDAPGYGPLQSPSVLAKLNESFYAPGGCRDLELACYAASDADAKGENGTGNSTLSDELCRKADDFCVCFFAISPIFPFSFLTSSSLILTKTKSYRKQTYSAPL